MTTSFSDLPVNVREHFRNYGNFYPTHSLPSVATVAEPYYAVTAMGDPRDYLACRSYEVKQYYAVYLSSALGKGVMYLVDRSLQVITLLVECPHSFCCHVQFPEQNKMIVNDCTFLDGRVQTYFEDDRVHSARIVADRLKIPNCSVKLQEYWGVCRAIVMHNISWDGMLFVPKKHFFARQPTSHVLYWMTPYEEEFNFRVESIDFKPHCSPAYDIKLYEEKEVEKEEEGEIPSVPEPASKEYVTLRVEDRIGTLFLLRISRQQMRYIAEGEVYAFKPGYVFTITRRREACFLDTMRKFIAWKHKGKEIDDLITWVDLGAEIDTDVG